MDKQAAKLRVRDAIERGFNSHRVLNKIFHESANEIVDVIFDCLTELKKEIEDERLRKAEEAPRHAQKQRQIPA